VPNNETKDMYFNTHCSAHPADLLTKEDAPVVPNRDFKSFFLFHIYNELKMHWKNVVSDPHKTPRHFDAYDGMIYLTN